ncbi:MAG: hypothetical protein QNJ90_07235 [Planctomycetota bacterium]|nr:hypothetical protein [Planctomycetota bacterium]
MKRYSMSLCVLLMIACAGCGSGFTLGEGTVTVNGLAPGQAILCGDTSTLVSFTGSGFQSEHGLELRILWTAVSGTPFDEGTSATAETTGTAVSDTLFQCTLPEAFGTFPVLITVILPGGNQGTSPPVTLAVGGELGPPDAIDDVYGAIGNVPLTVPAGTGVLFNDEDGDCRPSIDTEDAKISVSGSQALTSGSVVAYDSTTTLGGSVVMQPDGSFVYTPPLGVGAPAEVIENTTDTFTYTLEQSGGQDVATVRIDICEVVWFIDDRAAPGGNGQFQSPFNSLTSFMAQQFAGESDDPEEGDWIFVYQGNSSTSNPYDDGITLKSFQKLIGQGVDLVVCGQTIVTATDRPVLTNSGISIGETIGGPVIVLGDANEVRGLSTDGGQFGIYGFGVSGSTIVDEVDIQFPIIDGIRLDNTSGNFQIGDPAGTGNPAVDIIGGGGNGIRIGGVNGPTANARALTGGGPTVNVYSTDIEDFPSAGIRCIDANLNINFLIVDAVETGVLFHTLNPGSGCTLDMINSNIGLQQQVRLHGVDLQNFGADIDANVSFNDMNCLEPCIYAQAQAGPGIFLAFDSNSLTTGLALDADAFPTVSLQGVEGGITVTSMQNNTIVGTGFAKGIQAVACIFDANPATMGFEAVPGGTLGLGQNATSRMEGNSLEFASCFGALDLGATTIWQEGGDPAGFVNSGGGLTLTFTPAPTVNHVP